MPLLLKIETQKYEKNPKEILRAKVQGSTEAIILTAADNRP